MSCYHEAKRLKVWAAKTQGEPYAPFIYHGSLQGRRLSRCFATSAAGWLKYRLYCYQAGDRSGRRCGYRLGGNRIGMQIGSVGAGFTLAQAWVHW